MSIEFLATAFVFILMPGTGVLYTVAIGLGRGFRASVAAAAGCTFGIAPSAFASIVGLAAIFHASALAFQAMKIFGVAYLLYTAWKILREGGALDVSADRKPETLLRTAVAGTLLNVLNPKLSLFFLAFLPQFVAPGAGDALSQMGLMAGGFMAMTFVVFVGYGAASATARDYVISRPRVMAWLRRCFAGGFAFLGLRLALAER